MIGLLRDHMGGLARFSGREGQRAFWLWFALVFAMAMLGFMALFVPFMLKTMGHMQQFAIDHPEQVTSVSAPGHYEMRIEGHHPELLPDFGPIFAGAALMAVFLAVLLGAAMVRRLHDTGRGGAWALLPAPFLLIGLSLFPDLMASAAGGQFDMGLFAILFANNMLYLVSMALLLILLALPGHHRENTYGPPCG